MTFRFDMPHVGEGVVEVEIAEWKVAAGDLVAVDQPLCEVTTDKASLEITSPKAGRVVRTWGEPGEILKVDAPLCELDLDADRAASAAPEPAPQSSPPATPTSPPAAAPQAAPPPKAAPSTPVPAPAAAPPPVAPGEGAPVKAAPAVRRRAHELGLSLHTVPGSGPGGRVVHADLDAAILGSGEASAVDGAGGFAGAAAAAPPLAPPALPQVARGSDVGDVRVPIRGVRRKIAERMQAAKQTAPHFTYVEEIDCEALVALRQELKPIAAKRGVKLTYLPIIAKAVSVALRDFPNLNAVMDEEASELVVRGRHDFGFAVDTPGGLLVPVVRDVGRKTVLELAAAMDDVFARTRAGKAGRDELSGSSFTITSVGSIGGVFATPILNVPEVAILGLNQIKRRAVVLPDGSLAARWTTFVSPSFDHRIIDGAVAARFVARLQEILEQPGRLLLELA